MSQVESFKVTGLQELFKTLKDLPEKVLNRSIVRVNKAVMLPLAERSRQLAPNVTGATRASMAVKTKVYRKAGVVFTIVGPEVGHQVLIGTKRATLRQAFWSGKTTANVWHDPVKTSHLVELGHGGPHPAPPHPFIGRALDAQRASIAARYENEMRTEIERLVKIGRL